MITRAVSFDNEHGERLSGLLMLPADERARAYAIFAHCFTCSKQLKAVRTISRGLAQHGIATLSFDFAGLGDSEGELVARGFLGDVADLVAASSFLETSQGQAPAILVGHSLGGAAALWAASRLPQVRAVATIGAPADPAHLRLLFRDGEATEQSGAPAVLADVGGRPITVSQRFLDDLERYHTEAILPTLRRALLIIHSPVDQVVGIENAATLFTLAKHPKSFITLDRADHLMRDEDDACYAGQVIGAWARKYLRDALGMPCDLTSPSLDARGHEVVVRTAQEHYRSDIVAAGHALVADEPASVGGTELGPAPYDLLLAALGACTTMTLRMFADRKGWPLEAALVRLRHRKVAGADGQKVDHITRELELVGALDEAQRARLLEIADRCPVHRTLHGEVQVETMLGEA